jgi:hypothetical protein
VAQGRVEKLFLEDEACTERARFDKVIPWSEPADGGFAMKRGILAGMLAESQLVHYADGQGFEVDLDRRIDALIPSVRIGAGLRDRVAKLRTHAIKLVRGYQSSFPPDDGSLDWLEVESLLRPQHDLFVHRPDRSAIRVRPDVVVGVGDVLVAVEFTTAKDPLSISPARFALNHWALLRERHRRPEWGRFRRVATRVERLALGEGHTVMLDDGDADRHRLKIGQAAEDLLAERYQENRGPWCSRCPWQAACWFGDGHDETDAF